MLVEDAVQEIFISIWKNKASIRIERSILFYFIRSLRRRILKENSPYILDVDPEELQNSASIFLSADLSTENQIVEAETVFEKNTALKEAIALLSKRQQELIHLRYFQNLSNNEISRIMEINMNSLYKLASATIKKLRENIHLS